ncbi:MULTISPECIES: DUF397 domain-containing protein [Streptomyces]|uniref:DUF397 domain-containing protein n=1 Tax=Streptomyces edwardsiae TaxID=3075527 RepID=A0ABU2Q481_9ACTN|nr:DUF397 domain-containing protein [Streptomyces sp. DSM 41636]MDT0398704.1 DUF397 domain-containing protein [Streptomyces sp. DSM 41636]
MNARNSALPDLQAWRKSSYSSEEGGACVEVALRPYTVHVRDSKDINRPVVEFGSEAWAAFVGFTADRVG